MKLVSNLFRTTFILLILIVGQQTVMSQSKPVDKEKVKAVLHFSDSTGATQALVMYGSEVIGSFKATDCDSIYMNTASMVKSWTSLAVGILIDQGNITSVDDLVCQYLPEWKSGCENNVTIKHLLTMSSGLLKIRPASESILAQDDMNKFALAQRVTIEPGKKFSYSNEGVQILGILIERVSSQNADAFFRENLFTPLDMDSTSLYKDKAGNDIVYGGAKTTVQDASKVGLLLLNKGRYQGRQVVSESWIKKSITPSSISDNYGYLLWIDPSNQNSSMRNYAAMGDLGQMTIVFPQKNLIYIRQQSCINEDIPNLSWMGPNFINLVGSIINTELD